MHYLSSYLVVALLILPATLANGEELSSATTTKICEQICTPTDQSCWPLQYAGIFPGVTTDAQVQRLLGKGYGRTHELGSSREYIDRNRTKVLLIDMEYDSVVTHIEIRQFQKSDAMTPEYLRLATTRYFDPTEGFGRAQDLNIGSLDTEVKSKLGTPTRESGTEWVYELPSYCGSPQYIAVQFAGRHVSSIALNVFHELKGHRAKKATKKIEKNLSDPEHR